MKTKKRSRRILVAIICLAVVFATSLSALAAVISPNVFAATDGDTPRIRVAVSSTGVEFSTNRNTDLFDGLKGLMPGDELTQNVIIEAPSGNSSNCSLYMYAVIPEDEEITDGFLEYLNISTTDSGNTLDLIGAGTGETGVYLGEFTPAATKTISVTLNVSKDMGNDFMNATQYVDWYLYAEVIEEDVPPSPSPSPSPSPYSPPGTTTTTTITSPATATTTITNPETTIPDESTPLAQAPAIDIVDEAVPLGDIPITGDNSPIALLIVTAVLSGTAMLLLIVFSPKRNPSVK